MSNLKDLFDRNFLEYASYVIKDRAIPDIADGLKPVQRRILHSMYEMDDGKYNKVANIVGNTMKYHPHGDASIYSSLVVVANKEFFIDKQGNFGNILTGDEASAARYIECRLNGLAKEVLYNPDVTEYTDSYDGRNKEPVVLPAKVPVLLMMGAEGIAVGMSTKILPHNFCELLDAQVAILENKPYEIHPDFQQYGTVDVSEYKQGNGKVRVRGRIEKRNDKTLVIKEIPFGTTTESVIASIENASKKNQIKISSINDFTTEFVEIEVKTSRGESADDLINALYAFTDCEISISVNMLALIENKPKIMTVNEVLEYNTFRLKDLLEKELQIEEGKLTDRLHDLTLEQLFIENRVYKTIEELDDYNIIIDTIKRTLYTYKQLFIRALTDEDIEKLLEIKIKRISRYDINKNRKTIDDILKSLEKVRYNLAHIKTFTISYIKAIHKKYASLYPRRTKIAEMKTLSVKEIKQPDIKIFFNKETGFIGTDVKGDIQLTMCPQDKIIAFTKNGIFKIFPPESKVFVDSGALFVDVFNKERIYCAIYTDVKEQVSYIKKFQVQQFIQNKEYPFTKGNECVVNYFSTVEKEKIKISYIKKPKQKVNEEIFNTADIAVKGYSVLGNKLTTKEIKGIEVVLKMNK